LESHSIWFQSFFVCFLCILKGSGTIASNEEEISSGSIREVQERGIQRNHLGDISKMKQLSYASAAYGSITAYGIYLRLQIPHRKDKTLKVGFSEGMQ